MSKDLKIENEGQIRVKETQKAKKIKPRAAVTLVLLAPNFTKSPNSVNICIELVQTF